MAPFNMRHARSDVRYSVLAAVCAVAIASGCGTPAGETTATLTAGGATTTFENASSATHPLIGPAVPLSSVHAGSYAATNSASVNVSWRVEWPESGAGLSPAGLVEVRADLLDSAFGPLPLEPRPRTLDEAAAATLARAAEKESAVRRPGAGVTEGALSFVADLKLAWPFGRPGVLALPKLAESLGSAPRLVLVAVNEGYENEGGNGCHSYTVARVYALPSGRRLVEEDYFRPDALKALFELIVRRAAASLPDTRPLDAALRSLWPGYGNFAVEEKGIRWYLPAYSLFAGCAGVTSVFVSWADLKPWLRS